MPSKTQPTSSDNVGSTKKTCPLTPATLVVVTLRGDTGDFVVADVSIKGKTPGSGKTAADTGSKSFENIKGDEYTIEATNPVVQRSPAGAGALADKPSFEPAKEVKAIVPPGGDVMCVIEFVRQAQLKVKVYFLDGTSDTAKEELIGDVKVRLRYDGKLVEKITAKGTGLVDFGALPAGLYNLSVGLTEEAAKLYPLPADRNVRLARGENLTVPLRLEKRGRKRLRLRLVRGERRRRGRCRVEIEDSPTAAPTLKLPQVQIDDGDLDIVVPAHVATAAKGARVFFLGEDGKETGEASYLAVGQQLGQFAKASATSQVLRALAFLEREPFPEKLFEMPEQELEKRMALARSAQRLEMHMALARYQRTLTNDAAADGALKPFDPEDLALLEKLGASYWDYAYWPVAMPRIEVRDVAIPGPAPVPRRPQDPLLNCDLCVLAYHLYHQTLIWPLDPWYEVLARGKTDRRKHFMDSVHAFAGDLPARAGRELFAGPAVIGGLGSANLTLDPVLTNYGQIRPRDPAFTGDGGVYIAIKTPGYILDPIRRASIATYVSPFADDWPHGEVKITEIVDYGDGPDELIAFEGGTGSFKDRDAAWSMMGYVLKRTNADGTWDAHIVFRGSRSGNATRAVLNAGDGKFSGPNGNADWVTDLAGKQVANPYIGGEVATGFSGAFMRCAGTLQHALRRLHTSYGVPQSIQVAGHSLGAALASMCCGAFTSGSPGTELKKLLPGWPFDTLRGYFFALPPVATKEYCIEYNRLMGDRAQAPYVAGDMVVECSKSVSFKNTGMMGWIGARAGDNGRTPAVLDRMPRPAGFHSKENSHELYLIRVAVLDKLLAAGVPVPEAIQNATPWATYARFNDMLEGKPVSSVRAGAEVPKIITRENLRPVLKNYQFARHFEAFLKMLTKAVGDPKSYRGYHGNDQYRLAAERVALALEMCGKIESADPAIVADTVATQVAALLAYSAKKEWARKGLKPVQVVVKDISGDAVMEADELLGESFNTRIGLGLILRALEEIERTTIADFEKQPELELCLQVSLPDVNSWQLKQAAAAS